MVTRKTAARPATTPAKTTLPTTPPAAAAPAEKTEKTEKTGKVGKSTKARKADAPQPPPKADKGRKPPKLRPVLVRDGFTMPEADFALIGTLKARALAGGRETKKSELLRAGLQALAAMDSATLRAALDALEPVKTGRPKKAG